ncbi:MAG: VWA domain-containing protein [Oligoflexia bacterium]|nr:VWA domain-containing protein [Oligoflexia bacterium]
MKFGVPSVWIFGLLLGAIIMFAGWYGSARLRGSGKRNYLINLVFKAAAGIALILALGEPYLQSVSESSNAVVLLDVSDSLDLDKAAEALAKLRSVLPTATTLEILPFAKRSSEQPLISDLDPSFSKIKADNAALDIGASNLEAGLRSARSYDDSNVFLISDGWQTAGDVEKALPYLRSRLYPLLPEVTSGSSQEFIVSKLYAPLVAPAQRSVDIRVSVKNATAYPQRGNLQLKHGEKILLERNIEVRAGREDLFVLPSDPSEEGIKEITATLTPELRDFPRSSRTVFLSGEEREKVLLVSGAADDARFLPELLNSQLYQLKSVLMDSGSRALPELSDYSVVIFNNAALSQLPPDITGRVEKYIKQGGGFVMIGGNRSFGLGGFKDTAIEDVLPVKLAPPQTVKKRLNIAVELILDKSRSMASGSKLEFAKEAGREVIRNLKDDDYVGVIGFDSAPFEVIKLGQLGEIRESAMERVGRLFPTGKTNLLPAIDEARRRLEAVDAGRKHMIILTDGQLPDGGPYYVELVKQLRLVGITVSTVMLGGESDLGLLRSMGEVGGGAYYETDDPQSLPRIFLNDIKVSSGERTLKEQQEYQVRSGPSGISSTTIASFPPVRGYVQTGAKDGAELELLAYGGEKAEPLLASWKYGAGRSIAFTSDANGRWSNSWAGWPSFQRFWGDLVDSARPQSGEKSSSIKFDLRYFVERGKLVLDLSVFSEEAGGDIAAVLKLPNGSDRALDMTRLSRGHFRAELADALAGRYEFRANSGHGKTTPVGFYIAPEEFGERRGQGFNLPLLNDLAYRTGGKVNPAASDIKGVTYRKSEKRDVSGWFYALAIMLLLLEIVRREILSRLPRLTHAALRPGMLRTSSEQ